MFRRRMQLGRYTFTVAMAIRPKRVTRTGTLSPIEIPKGFTLVIDTREQKPLFDVPPLPLTIVRKAVKHGDYTVEGYEDQLTVERKMLSDFYGYIGKERKRTTAKIAALSNMFWAALVIEATEEELEKQYRYGMMTPEHARGFLWHVRLNHGIHTYITKKRRLLERYILEGLVYGYRALKKQERGENNAD